MHKARISTSKINFIYFFGNGLMTYANAQDTEPSYWGQLPANVRYCKKLSAQAKLLYVELTALTRKKGFCWATNSYFAELFETNERTIQRWIGLLAKEKFIAIEIVKEGLKTIRRIWVAGEEFKKFLNHDKFVMVEHDKNVMVDHDKNVTQNKIIELDNIFPNGNIEATPKGVDNSSAKPTRSLCKEEKKKLREFVSLSESQHQTLLKLHGKEKLESMLDILNSYKGSTGKKYKSDYHTMTEQGWVTKKINNDLKSNTLSKSYHDKQKNYSFQSSASPMQLRYPEKKAEKRRLVSGAEVFAKLEKMSKQERDEFLKNNK